MSPPSWQHVTINTPTGAIRVAELVDQPGRCAGCRRLFDHHGDPELLACGASFEPTLPDAALPCFTGAAGA